MFLELFIKGSFHVFLKYLPCLSRIRSSIIIVDGYVQLDDEGKWGLGAYLYDALEEKIPVIGVAKKYFSNNERHVRKVYRGESQQPLFVTSIGVEVDWASQKIQHMDGPYRIPTLLKVLDQHTKN